MYFTRFTLTQDGKHAGGFAALKQAVSTAAHLAADTGKPVTITAHAAGCASDTSGVFRNIRSGWTFTAKGAIQYADGTVEWDHSTDGRFEEVSP